MVGYNTKVCQSKQIDTTDLNGDKVMMNLDKGKYFALNSVGSRIWEIIEQEIYVKDLIKYYYKNIILIRKLVKVMYLII
ncbi:PqqD family peptide modification chaperone [Clostridium saccharobutylicum]|uniref:PqqD family peptide modification chaperone n=1 Tax=Clostridium saccharobutylicum TaxID=169679 RepID=UPI00181EE5D7|nr:hypothetical protein [Clostridium saccharobutylicum]